MVDTVLKQVTEMSGLSPEEMKKYRTNAVEVSEIALWKHNIYYYKQAYSLALDRIVHAMGAFPEYRETRSRTTTA